MIGADDMLRIKGAGHATGSSVHSLLLAAFALAIRDVADGRPDRILVRSSVDMRRRLEPHVSTALIFTAITGHITPVPDLDQPIAAIARSTAWRCGCWRSRKTEIGFRSSRAGM